MTANVPETASAKINDLSLAREEGRASNAGDLAVPDEFGLGHNYPNPFNPETRIRYDLPSAAIVTIAIFDINGKEVRRLLDSENAPAGSFSVVWDGRNALGRPSASGIYFYRLLVKPVNLAAKQFVQVKKMQLIK